jgi:hypothetical protein
MYYFVVWDEVSSCKKGIKPQSAWESVIQPTITTRWSRRRAEQFGAVSPGRAMMVGTPKGYNYFYTLFNLQDESSDWGSYHFDYLHSSLDRDEIEALRLSLDPLEFASEYLAAFKESGNSVFYCFDRKNNVRKDLEDFREGEVVHVNIDFNVGYFIMADNKFGELRGQPKWSILSRARNIYSTSTSVNCLKVQRLSLRGVHPSGWKHQMDLESKEIH